MRTVETGPPTIIPVSMRILGDDARVLRSEAEKLKAILKTSPFAINVRDDWGNDAIRTRLEIDQDRAGLAGVSSRDIAVSMYSAVNGAPIGMSARGAQEHPDRPVDGLRSARNRHGPEPAVCVFESGASQIHARPDLTG